MTKSALASGIFAMLAAWTQINSPQAEPPCGELGNGYQCGIQIVLPPDNSAVPENPGGGQGGGHDELTPIEKGEKEICDMPPSSQIPQECWFPDEDDKRPDDIPIETAPYPIVISEVKEFLTTTGELGIQPSEGQHVVNMTGVFWSTAKRHIVQAPILGQVFQVRFTPINYHFDFGDGSEPIDSPAPGAPYPDKTITHVYLQPGEYTTTLTVTWTGEFSINGSPFTLISGHVDTTVQSEPQLVREYHLVHVTDN